MKYNPTGNGELGPELNWEKIPEDDEVARRVVGFLGDQRLLFSRTWPEDERACVAAAVKCRAFLTDQLTTARTGRSLADSLRAVRAALRTFIDAAGPNARNFAGHVDSRGLHPYARALEALRGLVGLQLAIVTIQYGIEVDPALQQILPRLNQADES